MILSFSLIYSFIICFLCGEGLKKKKLKIQIMTWVDVFWSFGCLSASSINSNPLLHQRQLFPLQHHISTVQVTFFLPVVNSNGSDPRASLINLDKAAPDQTYDVLLCFVWGPPSSVLTFHQSHASLSLSILNFGVSLSLLFSRGFRNPPFLLTQKEATLFVAFQQLYCIFESRILSSSWSSPLELFIFFCVKHFQF